MRVLVSSMRLLVSSMRVLVSSMRVLVSSMRLLVSSMRLLVSSMRVLVSSIRVPCLDSDAAICPSSRPSVSLNSPKTDFSLALISRRSIFSLAFTSSLVATCSQPLGGSCSMRVLAASWPIASVNWLYSVVRCVSVITMLASPYSKVHSISGELPNGAPDSLPTTLVGFSGPDNAGEGSVACDRLKSNSIRLSQNSIAAVPPTPHHTR